MKIKGGHHAEIQGWSQKAKRSSHLTWAYNTYIAQIKDTLRNYLENPPTPTLEELDQLAEGEIAPLVERWKEREF